MVPNALRTNSTFFSSLYFKMMKANVSALKGEFFLKLNLGWLGGAILTESETLKP